MHDLQLPQNRSSIRREDHLLQMIDDDLVAAEGSEGRQHGRGNGATSIDIANDGAVLARIPADTTSVRIIFTGSGRRTHDW